MSSVKPPNLNRDANIMHNCCVSRNFYENPVSTFCSAICSQTSHVKNTDFAWRYELLKHWLHLSDRPTVVRLPCAFLLKHRVHLGPLLFKAENWGKSAALNLPSPKTIYKLCRAENDVILSSVASSSLVRHSTQRKCFWGIEGFM